MDPNAFLKPSGNLVPIISGQRAFIPAPLPQPLDFSPVYRPEAQKCARRGCRYPLWTYVRRIEFRWERRMAERKSALKRAPERLGKIVGASEDHGRYR